MPSILFAYVLRIFQRVSLSAGTSSAARSAAQAASKQGYLKVASNSLRSLRSRFTIWADRGGLLTRMSKALGVQMSVEAVLSALAEIAGDVISTIELDPDSEIASIIEDMFEADGEISLESLGARVGSDLGRMTIIDALIYIVVLMAVVFRSRGQIFEKLALKYAVGAKSFGRITFQGKLLFAFGWHKGGLVLKDASGKILVKASDYAKNPVYWVLFIIAALPIAYWVFLEENTTDENSEASLNDLRTIPIVLDSDESSDKGSATLLTHTSGKIERNPGLAALRDKVDKDGIVTISELE